MRGQLIEREAFLGTRTAKANRKTIVPSSWAKSPFLKVRVVRRPFAGTESSAAAKGGRVQINREETINVIIAVCCRLYNNPPKVVSLPTTQNLMYQKRFSSLIEDNHSDSFPSGRGSHSTYHAEMSSRRNSHTSSQRSLFYHESTSDSSNEQPTLAVDKLRNATDTYVISEIEFLDFLTAVFQGAGSFLKLIYRAFGYTLRPLGRLRSVLQDRDTLYHLDFDETHCQTSLKQVSQGREPSHQRQLDFSEPASNTERDSPPAFNQKSFLSNGDLGYRPLRTGYIENKDYTSRLLETASSASRETISAPAERGTPRDRSLSSITESLHNLKYKEEEDEEPLSYLWELFKETTFVKDDRLSDEEDFSLYRSILKEKKKRQELLSKLRVEKPQKVKPLTGMQLSDVLAHWRSPVNRLIKSMFNTDIYTEDLKRLKDGKWLNDNIIDVYLSMVVQRSKDLKGELADVFAFTTHFYSTLSKRGHSGVARWAKRKKVDVTNMDYVFIPVNVLNSHWTLAIVNNKQQRFQYCDSMNGAPGLVLRNLKDYMIKESERIYGSGGKPDVDYNEWGFDTNVKCPQQENGFDCGVFLCTNVEYLSREKALSFSQSDMSTIRQRMAFEILTERLIEK